MKRKVKELKRIARGNLLGNYLTLMKAYIWTQMLTLLVEMPFSLMHDGILFSPSNLIYMVAVLLIQILSILLVCGQYRMHLSVARSGSASSKEFWEPIKNQPDRYIITNFIVFGLSLLCLLPMFGGLWLFYQNHSLENALLALGLSILSLVFNTYVTLNFHLVFFLLLDSPSLTALPALKEVHRMVMGHKRRYLYLQLSFLGYQALNLLTFGIGTLWIEPYMTQTLTTFYLDLKGELVIRV